MPATADIAKKRAADAALREVRSGMRLGLGTGSTMAHFLDGLGAALAAGTLEGIVGVPTSLRTERHCREVGIPLMELDGETPLELAVDGADEVAPNLSLIKGLGGAHLREKMVVQASRRFIVIADESKCVSRLGEKAPVPVEVASFQWSCHLPFFRTLDAEPILREKGGEPYRTDNGNLVVDLHFAEGIPDPAALEGALRGRAGVVETGLFLGMAHRAYVARGDEVAIMEPPEDGWR